MNAKTALPFLLLLLPACSVLNEHYLLNHTDHVLSVQIRFLQPDERMTSNRLGQMRQGPLVSKVKAGLRETLPDPVAAAQHGKDTVSFTMAPRSVVYLGTTRNTSELFAALDVTGPDIDLRVTRDNLDDFVEIRDPFFGGIAVLWSIPSRTAH